MTEEEIIKKYESERPILESWGNYIKDCIIKKLQEKYNVDTFLKVPVTVRVKEVDSLVTKALHRNKGYANPYEDITDKVGIRFVVLLTTDIDIVSQIIKNQGEYLWNVSEDRNFEEERLENPEQFTYESVHFVLRSKKEIMYNGQKIPKNMPCEVQIRTLLQHAYAEMSHDTIYKPQVKATPGVKRWLARSMALVESADIFFLEAAKEIVTKSKPQDNITEVCVKYYPTEFKKEIIPEINNVYMDALFNIMKKHNLNDDTFIKKFGEWLDIHNKETDSFIEYGYNSLTLCRQPAILLIYYLIKTNKIILSEEWPWPLDTFNKLLSNAGETPVSYGRA